MRISLLNNFPADLNMLWGPEPVSGKIVIPLMNAAPQVSAE